MRNHTTQYKMDKLTELLQMKADSIIDVVAVVDIEPTVLNREDVLNLIKVDDPDFYEAMKGWEGSFTYGDKYFWPLDEQRLFCVPAKAENLSAWLEKNATGNIDIVIKDFEQHKPQEEDGYFDLRPMFN